MSLNKGISTPIAILIVIGAVLVGGIAFWQYEGLPAPGSGKSGPEQKRDVWYQYQWESQDGKIRNLDLIITESTEKEWKGIVGMRGSGFRGDRAALLKFKISKEDLSLRTSFPLKPSELEEGVKYYSLKKFSGAIGDDLGTIYFLFPLSLFKEMAGLYPPQLFEEQSVRLIGEQGEVGTLKLKKKIDKGKKYRMVLELSDSGKMTVLTRASEPYRLVDLTASEEVTDAFDIHLDGTRDYSLKDLRGYYSGYEMKTALKSSLRHIPRPGAQCPDGVTAELRMENNGVKVILTPDLEVSRNVKPENPEVSPNPSMNVSWEKDLLRPGQATVISVSCTESGIPASCRYTFELEGQTIGTEYVKCNG